MSTIHNKLETAGTKPKVSEINEAEIVINEVDRLLYTKDKNGVVIPVGGSNAGSFGRLATPLLDLPLQKSLAINNGTESATFTRSTAATYIDRYGVVKASAINTPRFEKDGLLIEGASTNDAFYSEDFTQAKWVVNGGATFVQGKTSPDNGLTALEVTALASGDGVKSSQSITGGRELTVSFFLRSNSSATVRIAAYESGIGVKYGPTLTLTSEWKKYSFTYTYVGACQFQYVLSSGAGVFEVWGEQVEALPFASSYIPTTTVEVSRAAEVCTLPYENNYFGNNNTGSYSVEISSLGQIPSYIHIALSGSTRFSFYMSNNEFKSYIGGDIAIVVAEPLSLLPAKYVGTASETRASLYKDGIHRSSVAHANTVTKNDIIYIGSASTAGRFLFGHIKNLKIYDVILTAEEARLL